WEKQKGSRGIRRGQWYRLVFQFPIRERQMEGIAAAKARGVYRGRKPSIDPAEVYRLYTIEKMGATAIARQLGIGRASVYRALENYEQPA
ncbi:helix-turn-helix domain-containing protein, partial [Salmonella sp. NW76]|uniref:helix-turn-helix domain-containing protein n=1 Tax=unclassified Salmonella TaxID=2614656 RepID=UPI003F42409C